MATLTVSIDANRMKADAQKHWGIVCKSAVPMSVNSLRVGFHAAYLKKNNLWGILGFASEKEAQQASGIKESSWYNVIRIAEAYPGVEEEVFVSLKLSNAEAAMDLSERKRTGEKWLKLAAETPIKEFAKMVDEELDGAARPSDTKERIVPITIKMPKTRKKVVEERLLAYAESVGAKDDIGRGLELLVAEQSEGVSLIESITAAINDIAEMKQLGQKNLSAAEVLEQVYSKLDVVVDRFREALESAQNGSGEE